MKVYDKAVVEKAGNIGEGIYELYLSTEAAKYAKPGQFIMVYPNDKSTLLPRPISICEMIGKKVIRIAYRVAGKGTREFSCYEAGDEVRILGPLGNGYPLDAAKGKRTLLIGGGIGLPPILELSKRLSKEDITIALGYRNDDLFLLKQFQKYGNTLVATEDGSAGVKGNVLDAIMKEKRDFDVIFACGPMPMLKAIKNYAGENNIPAYISLEERMACGIGACLGCVCKTVKKDSHSHVNNARVCTEGPVFLASEVEI